MDREIIACKNPSCERFCWSDDMDGYCCAKHLVEGQKNTIESLEAAIDDIVKAYRKMESACESALSEGKPLEFNLKPYLEKVGLSIESAAKLREGSHE